MTKPHQMFDFIVIGAYATATDLRTAFCAAFDREAGERGITAPGDALDNAIGVIIEDALNAVAPLTVSKADHTRRGLSWTIAGRDLYLGFDGCDAEGMVEHWREHTGKLAGVS